MVRLDSVILSKIGGTIIRAQISDTAIDDKANAISECVKPRSDKKKGTINLKFVSTTTHIDSPYRMFKYT